MSVHVDFNTSILQVMQADSDGHHKAHLSHEIIAAAAAYEVCDLLDHRPSSL